MLVKNIKNNAKITAILIVLLLSAVFLFANFDVVSAQTADLGMDHAENLGLSNAGGRSIQQVMVTIVRWLLTFVGLIAVVMIMWAGFLWMTSGGNEEKVQKAKRTLINSVIGVFL